MVHGARDSHDMQTFRTLDMICSRVHKPDAPPDDMESNSILEMAFAFELKIVATPS